MLKLGRYARYVTKRFRAVAKRFNKRRIKRRIRRSAIGRWFYPMYRLIRYMYPVAATSSVLLKIPPGHYYSPVPNMREVLARSQVLFDQPVEDCPGIDLKEEAQLELLESFSRYDEDLPFSPASKEGNRYFYKNGFFGYGDAIALYFMMRHYEPRKVIEVGSGYSSAAMLDINDMFLDSSVQFTFVEPFPKRLLGLLNIRDKNAHTVLHEHVQDVPLEVFSTLSTNDVLFVDSSHNVKAGSDVGHILFHILPRLRPGVLVHFHDVFWPFEYPKEWIVEKGRAWNEAYFLRSFLQYNKSFEIVYFSSFLAQRYAARLREKMPRYLGGSEMSQSNEVFARSTTSLWLKKVT